LCETWRKNTLENDIVTIVVSYLNKFHLARIFQTWWNSSKKTELKCLQIDHEVAGTETLFHAKYLMNIISPSAIIKF